MIPRRLLSFISILLCTVLLTCIPEETIYDIPFEPITKEYSPGDTVHLVAEPNPGWEFTHWTVNGDSTWGNIEYIFTMPVKDIDVVANFTRK